MNQKLFVSVLLPPMIACQSASRAMRKYYTPSQHESTLSPWARQIKLTLIVILRSKLPPRLHRFATRGALIKLPMLPFAVIVVGIFILLRPFVIIQIYKVHDWRIGHMAATTQSTLEIHDWNQTNRRKKIVLFFFGTRHSSNDFLKKLIMRRHYSLQNNWGFLLYHLCSKVSFLIATTQYQTSDKLGLFDKYGPPLQFSTEEISVGKEFLSQFGLVPFGKFVCLNVRDDSYLKITRGHKKFLKHTHRNADIGTYLPAAEYLAERGYTVFRMGASAKDLLSSSHSKVIDYAANGMRTEFLDIYLGAHCGFCISTCSGWDEIPKMFNRQVMFANIVPILEINVLTRPVLIYPKQLIDLKTNQLLNINDALNRGLANQSNPYEFQKNGVGVVDLTSDELLAATAEMSARIEGTFVETPEQKQMQAQLKQLLSTHPTLQPAPNYYPIRAEFVSCFLSKYRNYLD
jgi:putative glycosyltransferase (TIGR04372 family)